MVSGYLIEAFFLDANNHPVYSENYYVIISDKSEAEAALKKLLLTRRYYDDRSQMRILSELDDEMTNRNGFAQGEIYISELVRSQLKLRRLIPPA